jgi:hypothetical protein
MNLYFTIFLLIPLAVNWIFISMFLQDRIVWIYNKYYWLKEIIRKILYKRIYSSSSTYSPSKWEIPSKYWLIKPFFCLPCFSGWFGMIYLYIFSNLNKPDIILYGLASGTISIIFSKIIGKL